MLWRRRQVAHGHPFGLVLIVSRPDARCLPVIHRGCRRVEIHWCPPQVLWFDAEVMLTVPFVDKRLEDGVVAVNAVRAGLGDFELCLRVVGIATLLSDGRAGHERRAWSVRCARCCRTRGKGRERRHACADHAFGLEHIVDFVLSDTSRARDVCECLGAGQYTQRVKSSLPGI